MRHLAKNIQKRVVAVFFSFVFHCKEIAPHKIHFRPVFIHSHPLTDKLNCLHVRCAMTHISQINFYSQALNQQLSAGGAAVTLHSILALNFILKTNLREPYSTITAQTLMMTFEEMTEVPQSDNIMTVLNSLLVFFPLIDLLLSCMMPQRKLLGRRRYLCKSGVYLYILYMTRHPFKANQSWH